jgi:hypothetical protein
VLKRLRSIGAGTFSAVDDEAVEAVEVEDPLSEAMGDVDGSALTDSDMLDAEDAEVAPPVAFTDDGSVEVAFSEGVTATETATETATATANSDCDTLLDHVAVVAGEFGWDGFVEQYKNDADDDEEEEDDERTRSFQLYEMEIFPAAP